MSVHARNVHKRPLVEIVEVWWTVAKLWFVEDRYRAWSQSIAVIAFSFLHTLLLVKVSYAQRDFSSSLAEKKEHQFYEACWTFFLIIAIAAPLFSLNIYLEERLIIEWRTWMTKRLLEKYYRNRAYFRLQLLGEMDNPDQRITDDVAAFTRASTYLVMSIIQKVMNMTAFCSVLWSVSPRLVVFLLAYASFGTFITVYWFGRKLMMLTYRSLQREGDLRFALVRTRENAESIAFFGGGRSEAIECKRRLRSLYWVLLCRNAWTTFLELFTNYYRYITVLIPPLALGPSYFAGRIQFGTITQATYAFDRIEVALSTIVSKFSQFSGLAAETERLAALIDALDRGGERSAQGRSFVTDAAAPGQRFPAPSTATAGAALPEGPPSPQGSLRRRDPLEDGLDSENPLYLGKQEGALSQQLQLQGRNPLARVVPAESIVRLENPELTRERLGRHGEELEYRSASVLTVTGMTMCVPRGSQLICRDLDLVLQRGTRLLIVGPSGCGKSSLLRAISGLWTDGSGTINVPPTSEVFFVPQKPFMNFGSLRSQLLFPRADPAAATSPFTGSREDHHPTDEEIMLTISGSPSLAQRLTDLIGVPIFSRGPRGPIIPPWDPWDEPSPSSLPSTGPPSTAAISRSPSSNGQLGTSPRQISLGVPLPSVPPREAPESLASVGAGRPCPSDALLLHLMAECGLRNVTRMHRLDEEADWGQVLSVGEQQRVAMCRLLVANPLLAFLDEATSALDSATESRLYELLSQRVESYVSVGHRMQLLSYHTHVLECKENGVWRLCSVHDYQQDQAHQATRNAAPSVPATQSVGVERDSFKGFFGSGG